jgi:hypothetical protein
MSNAQSDEFVRCPKQFARRIEEKRKECALKRQLFELTDIERGSGSCVEAAKWTKMDLSEGDAASLTLTKTSNLEHKITLKNTCPLSLDKKSGNGKFANAKPFASCMIRSQKICSTATSGKEGKVSCVHLSKATCQEVCVEPRFCAIAIVGDTPGELVKRKYGWRSPDGKVCCYKDCQLPDSWINAKGGRIEPDAWCNQEAIKGVEEEN